MKRWMLCLAFIVFTVLLDVGPPVQSHDAITTTITWNREVSRIFAERCVTCHREGGKAFSLTTYADARPWAVAIKEETLSRRMPPWGAVRGFQEFRNDQSLTPEQLELISSWVEGGVPEGDAKDLSGERKAPVAWASADSLKVSKNALTVTGDLVLSKQFKLDGVLPQNVAKGSSFQVIAEVPGGAVIPLLWLYEYQPQFQHAFRFQKPVSLPAKTRIYGLPPGSSVLLLPAR